MLGMTASKTSVRPRAGWLVIKCPPQRMQNRRSLIPVLLYRPSAALPLVTLTFSAFHKMKDFTGSPELDGQERQ